MSRNTPDFISPLLWLPNSPDLNPVDYEVWSVLQQRVYRSRIRDGATENAGLENAGLENAAPDCRGGKRGSSTVWKAEVSVI